MRVVQPLWGVSRIRASQVTARQVWLMKNEEDESLIPFGSTAEALAQANDDVGKGSVKHQPRFLLEVITNWKKVSYSTVPAVDGEGLESKNDEGVEWRLDN